MSSTGNRITDNRLTGLYHDFCTPLGLINIILRIIEGNQDQPNIPQIQQVRAPREWYSQPRTSSDPTIEVLQVNFKLPLSISTLGFQALRVPSSITVYYRDRNNNWIPLTDASHNAITIKLNYSAVSSWYTYQGDVYPVVATALQIRLQRNFDAQVGNNPYVVGLKETLIRRNVYSLESASSAIESQQDLIGNTITSYVEPWPASDAVDDDPKTYWKSFPCPDPAGVVALYLDARHPDGTAQLFDIVYIDPVYDGQNLNVYYSNDDTRGTLVVSPTPIAPNVQTNSTWTLSKGMVDSSAPGASNSELKFPIAWGPMVSEPVWIGIEWTPDFDAGSAPSQNPILFSCTPENPTAAAAAGQFWPIVYYDVGAGEITLEFTNGTVVHSFSQVLTPILLKQVPYQVVVGWNYNPSSVYISVTAQGADDVGTTLTEPATMLPSLITLDGQTGYKNFRGNVTATVVKMAPWSNGSSSFQANAVVYANPNPVIPDANGNYPSTSLDDAIFSVDWTAQQFPIGGVHDSWFDNKVWTPIFANYVTAKGSLFLPQTVSARYVKLEFTNLTAEPYPIYDEGVQVTYETFPVSVIQQSTATRTSARPGGLLGVLDSILTLGSDIVTASSGGINWLNQSTTRRAVDANWGQTQSPIQVVTGPGIITGSIPNTSQANINTMYRSEQSNPYVYSRSMPNASFLAGQTIAVIGGQPDSTQGVVSGNDTNAPAVTNAFTPVVSTSKSNVLPQQGSDWWLFPGANLKMPSSVMNALINRTHVETQRGPSMTTRIRFQANSVHRYDTKTVTLDAALAYFAGVAEVALYHRTYIAANDPASFAYDRYDPTQFTYTNVYQEDSGPLTMVGSPYQLANPNFLSTLKLTGWTPTGAWFWDATHGVQGGECCGVVANGNPLTFTANDIVHVSPGDQIVISAWVAYDDIVSTSGATISIAATGYLAGVSQGAVTLSAPASGSGPVITNPSGTIDGRLFQQLIGLYTVPSSGIDAVQPSLNVSSTCTSGVTYWTNVEINPAGGNEATLFLDAHTTSTFDKVTCNFSDSGLVTSDAMWAQADPLDTNIDNLTLAYYVTTYPSSIPSGVWADSFAEWGDTSIEWGEPIGEVAINVDPNLIYQGNRALHFTRAAGAGNAGVIIRQQTNFVAEGLAQLGCTFLKAAANANQITITLRRVSDGVVIHQETFTPVVGYWYTYQTGFFEVPNSTDQVYDIEFLASGDDVDELYLSNLYTNIANIRYFVQLGGASTFLFDVTPLRYGTSCAVTCTAPVNELSLVTAIYSADAWAFGAALTPHYLK